MFVVGMFIINVFLNRFHFNPKTMPLLFLLFFLGQTDLGMSLVSGYTLMLGDFDLEQYTATSSVKSSIGLFVIFVYLVNLVPQSSYRNHG